LIRRKIFSERVEHLVAPYKWVVLAMVDGKDYSNIIWKTLEPKFEKI
jgi:hypothetical protein